MLNINAMNLIRPLRCGTGLRRIAIAILAICLFVPSTGCNMIRTFDETAALTYRDFVWTKRAYNLRYGNCNRPYGEHFRNGFLAGYEDISNGRDGYVPALPPEDYRGYEFQSADGAKCVNAWFEGYPAGVAAAKQDKSGNYHNVMVSRMIDAAIKQENTATKLPGEVPIVGRPRQTSTASTVYPPMPLANDMVVEMPSVMTEPAYETDDAPMKQNVVPAAYPARTEFQPPPTGTSFNLWNHDADQ